MAKDAMSKISESLSRVRASAAGQVETFLQRYTDLLETHELCEWPSEQYPDGMTNVINTLYVLMPRDLLHPRKKITKAEACERFPSIIISIRLNDRTLLHEVKSVEIEPHPNGPGK